MNGLFSWFSGFFGGMGFLGLIINFPLWSDNESGIILAFALCAASFISLFIIMKKEEKIFKIITIDDVYKKDK